MNQIWSVELWKGRDVETQYCEDKEHYSISDPLSDTKTGLTTRAKSLTNTQTKYFNGDSMTTNLNSEFETQGNIW